MNSTSKPNSLTTNSITSASKRWLIETMIPKFIHLPIISAILTSINDANSLTLINSVTCNLLSSDSLPIASAISSRLARRCLALRLFPLPVPPDNLAWVCLIFSCISFESISLFSERSPFFSGLNREGCAGRTVKLLLGAEDFCCP